MSSGDQIKQTKKIINKDSKFRDLYHFEKFIVFLLLFTIVSTVFSQESNKIEYNGTKWEYMVISFGKTYFSNAEKTLLYFEEYELPTESTDIQNKLDILGANGWEVVTIVGVIGGSQQILLKRIYNKELVEKDKTNIETIKKEKQKQYEEQREKEQLAKKEIETTEKDTLIDLDKLDAVEIEKEKNEKEEQLRLQKVQADKKYILSIYENYAYKGVSKSKKIDGDNYFLTFDFDLTKEYLINENQFRSSEVERFAYNRLNEIQFDENILIHSKVFITINCNITYKNKVIKVAQVNNEIGAWILYK